MTYRQISFDTQQVSPGSKIPANLPFFEPNRFDRDQSIHITNLDEKTLMRWMLLYKPLRSILFQELRRSPAALYWPEVVEPFFHPGEGEIDLVVSELHAPHEAIAIEAKLVKVEIENRERDRLSKLKNVGDGVQQANRRYDRHGFFQQYLAVITAVDASSDAETNVPCRGLRSHSSDLFGDRETFSQIVDFPKRDELKDDIGILFLEVVQPSQVAFDRRATFRVCVQRPAQCRSQSSSVTNRVEEMMPGVLIQ